MTDPSQSIEPNTEPNIDIDKGYSKLLSIKDTEYLLGVDWTFFGKHEDPILLKEFQIINNSIVTFKFNDEEDLVKGVPSDGVSYSAQPLSLVLSEWAKLNEIQGVVALKSFEKDIYWMLLIHEGKPVIASDKFFHLEDAKAVFNEIRDSFDEIEYIGDIEELKLLDEEVKESKKIDEILTDELLKTIGRKIHLTRKQKKIYGLSLASLLLALILALIAYNLLHEEEVVVVENAPKLTKEEIDKKAYESSLKPALIENRKKITDFYEKDSFIRSVTEGKAITTDLRKGDWTTDNISCKANSCYVIFKPLQSNAARVPLTEELKDICVPSFPDSASATCSVKLDNKTKNKQFLKSKKEFLASLDNVRKKTSYLRSISLKQSQLSPAFNHIDLPRLKSFAIKDNLHPVQEMEWRATGGLQHFKMFIEIIKSEKISVIDFISISISNKEFTVKGKYYVEQNI